MRVAWDLRKQDCDVVHIHNYSQFVPVIRALNPHVKIILHMHCEWLSQLDARMIERRLEQTDLVIGCSNHVVEKVKARFPQFSDRCCVIANGVDVERFGVSPASVNGDCDSTKRLLYVGRVSPEKGVHVLLKAVEVVYSQIPEIQVDVVGGFGSAPFEYMVLISEEDTVRALAAFYQGWRHTSDYPEQLRRELPLHLQGRVNFVGELPHNEVVDYYHRAHVFVNPSLSEAFGLSLVEAMASKKPVVATNVGGMKEVVDHGMSGLLVEPANPEALAEALIYVLKDDGLRQSMGEVGHRRVTELYTWKRVSDSLWEKYAEVINQSKAASLTVPPAQPVAEAPMRGNAQ
jgi:glycosyltransferase involved in cell wall biosynthesis